MLQLAIALFLTICIGVDSDDNRRSSYLDAFRLFVGISNPVVKAFSTRGEAQLAWVTVALAALNLYLYSHLWFSQLPILEGLLMVNYLTAKIWINPFLPSVASAEGHERASSPAGRNEQSAPPPAPPAHDSLPRADSQIAPAASEASLPTGGSSRRSGRSGPESAEARRQKSSQDSVADSNPDPEEAASNDSGGGGNGGRATGAGSAGSLRHRRQGARRTDAGDADEPALQPPEPLRPGYVMVEGREARLHFIAPPQGRRGLQDAGRGGVSEGGAASVELPGVVNQPAPGD